MDGGDMNETGKSKRKNQTQQGMMAGVVDPGNNSGKKLRVDSNNDLSSTSPSAMVVNAVPSVVSNSLGDLQQHHEALPADAIPPAPDTGSPNGDDAGDLVDVNTSQLATPTKHEEKVKTKRFPDAFVTKFFELLSTKCEQLGKYPDETTVEQLGQEAYESLSHSQREWMIRPLKPTQLEYLLRNKTRRLPFLKNASDIQKRQQSMLEKINLLRIGMAQINKPPHKADGGEPKGVKYHKQQQQQHHQQLIIQRETSDELHKLAKTISDTLAKIEQNTATMADHLTKQTDTARQHLEASIAFREKLMDLLRSSFNKP